MPRIVCCSHPASYALTTLIPTYPHHHPLPQCTPAGSVPIVLTEEESKPAEQFIFLCWTRHSHTLVQELMESTKQYVAEKQYTEALAALSEVIKIDPFFAEAYNRRATVHFGLKCADDCFADIERVRSKLPACSY